MDTGFFSDEADNPESGPLPADLVEVYVRSAKGRAVVTIGSTAVGTALGAAISESTVRQTRFLALAGGCIGLIMSFAQGAFGDLFRALGLGVLLSLKRSHRVSVLYPMWPQLRAALHFGPRAPFPPTAAVESPWKYRAGERGLVFSMTKSMLAVAFVGGAIGYILSRLIIFLPDVLAALAVGGAAAYLATRSSAGGDLVRLLGMRVVALASVIAGVDDDVGAWDKASVVGSMCFSKLIAWDRKYQVTRKLTALLASLIAWAKGTAAAARGNDSPYGDDSYPEEDMHGRRRPPPQQRQQQQQRRHMDEW